MISTLFDRNHATIKLMFIGVLSLAMLIPLSMVRSVVAERQNMQSAARDTIANRWGGSQLISGLVALTEQKIEVQHDRRTEFHSGWQANVLDDLLIQTRLTTEWRNLGIYEFPVYTAVVNISGRIGQAKLKELKPQGDILFWLPLSDVRGVREISTLKLGEIELPAQPLSVAPTIISGLQFTLPAEDRMRAGDAYRLELKLAGSDSLLFLPLAETTRASLQADWAHPEFVGQFLPIERSITEESTSADWQLLGLNRPYGDHWPVKSMPMHDLNMAAFGMRLETPVDVYQRSERSAKYGFLFISLTFFTFFLFEVMTARPLHPVPYMLTGAALAIFYLVLLALSEYLPFYGAFLMAAALLVSIVTPYTATVLGAWRHGCLVGVMMGLTYALLYVLVTAEHAALLMGSLSLLAAIAGLMFLTRRVDWYDYGVNKVDVPAS